jgi:hypothetical protein
MVLLGDEAQLDARFGLFEIVLILIGAWFAANVPLANEAQVDARFGLFGKSANLDAR